MLLALPRGASFGWGVLLQAAGLDAIYGPAYAAESASEIMYFLIEDERTPCSIVASLHHARVNTRTFREVLPMEIWERNNGLHLYIRDHAERATTSRSQRYEVLNSVIKRRQPIIGLLMGSMSQDLGHPFIKLGRNLERANTTTRILDVNSAIRVPDEFARQRLRPSRNSVSTDASRPPSKGRAWRSNQGLTPFPEGRRTIRLPSG